MHLIKHFVLLLLLCNSASAQSLFKSDYTNIGDYGLNIGYGYNSSSEDNILNLNGRYRLLFINMEIDISSMLGDSLLAPNSGYTSLKSGLALPLLHSRLFSTSVNANVTYNLFDTSDTGFVGEWGWECYGMINFAFGYAKIGYNSSPNSDIPFLMRNGVFGTLAIGFNQFVLKDIGSDSNNFYNPKLKNIYKSEYENNVYFD